MDTISITLAAAGELKPVRTQPLDSEIAQPLDSEIAVSSHLGQMLKPGAGVGSTMGMFADTHTGNPIHMSAQQLASLYHWHPVQIHETIQHLARNLKHTEMQRPRKPGASGGSHARNQRPPKPHDQTRHCALL